MQISTMLLGKFQYIRSLSPFQLQIPNFLKKNSSKREAHWNFIEDTGTIQELLLSLGLLSAMEILNFVSNKSKKMGFSAIFFANILI